jgi:toxin ParE1/3/4
MMRVVWSPDAEGDLIGLWAYLEREASATTADAQITRLHEASQKLAELPHAGRRRNELMPGLRSRLVSPYLVFYRVDVGEVQIVRVLHGSRDLTAIFTDES